MIKIERKKNKYTSEGINIAPLIDMIFILLLFFVVNAAFFNESGLDINKPSAQNSSQLEKNSIVIYVTQDERIIISNRQIELLSLSGSVKNELNEKNGCESVIIIPDKSVQSGLLIRIMDECKTAGIKNISVATEKHND
ncbi:biopolymer transporter ExbD [Candidatus Dependentiae bacterium]|nr:biopolymer transporter ExbD [Candidatus Dependentiae bacterium]